MSSNNNDLTGFPKVICLGEALIDRLGAPGGDPDVDQNYEDCFGGAPANVACALAKLGIKVAFLGRLGNDSIGTKFRNLMVNRGVDIKGIQLDYKRPTRVVLVRRLLSGERIFHGFFGGDQNGFADDALSLKEIKEVWSQISMKALWVLVGTIPLATPESKESLVWVLNEAKKKNIKIALDINWRPTFWDKNNGPESGPNEQVKKKISPILEMASLIKLAREEAIWFFNTDDPAKISTALPQSPDVVVTDGSRPLKWLIDDFHGQMKPLSPTKVLDTTGAGDAFTAGLIFQLLNVSSYSLGLSEIEKIFSFAAACGALVCGGAGAISPQPTQKEVLDFLQSSDGAMK